MKAAPRKTKPVQAGIADVWTHPLGAPLGLCELRDGGRVLARVQPVNQRRIGACAMCDWRLEVFAKDGAVIASQVMEHGAEARERAHRLAETFRKQGRV